MTGIVAATSLSESLMPTQVRAHWKAAVGIIAAVVAAMAMAYFVSRQATSVFTAEARLVVTSGLGLDAAGGGDVLEAPLLGQTYAVLATTRPVLLDVIQRTGLPYAPDELASHLSVTADLDTPFLTLSMTDEDPGRAAVVANALAEILVDRGTVPSRGIGAEFVPARTLLAVVELAAVPEDPSGPRVVYNTALAGAAALILGLVVVAGLAYMRQQPARPSGARAE